MDACDDICSGRRNSKIQLPGEKRGRILEAVLTAGKVLAWIAAAFAALTALGAGTRWLISTSFVSREVAASELVTRKELHTLEQREAEHYESMQDALREFSRSNDDSHKEIKGDTNRILQLLLQERRRQ